MFEREYERNALHTQILFVVGLMFNLIVNIACIFLNKCEMSPCPSRDKWVANEQIS